MSVNFADGTAFRHAIEVYIGDGVAWRQATEVHMGDGTAFRQGFPSPRAFDLVAITDIFSVKVSFSVSAGAQSVRYRSQVNGGGFGSFTTLNVTPGSTGNETNPTFGLTGDQIDFEIEPFSGTNLAGENGPVAGASGVVD